MTELEILKRVACSDGNCVFKVTPEMRKGMHTNGGCHCANEASTDYDKKSGIRALSRIATESLAKVTELEKMCCEFSDRLSDLEDALKDIAKGCYDAEGCESIAQKALE